MKLSVSEALLKAIKCHQNNNTKEALRIYKLILDFDHKHPVANHNLGLILRSTRKYGEALNHFKIAFLKNPKKIEYLNSYSMALIEQRAYPEILELIQHISNLGSVDVAIQKCLHRLVKASENLGEYEQISLTKLVDLYASKSFNEIISKTEDISNITPNAAKMLNIRGAAFAELSDVTNAEICYKQSIVLDPKSAHAYNNLGNILKATGRLKEAQSAFEKAIDIIPTHAEAHNNLGNLLRDTGKSQSALHLLKRAIKLKPNYAEAYNNLGLTFLKLLDPLSAEDKFNTAIKLQSNYADPYNNLGIIRLENNRPSEAIKFFKLAIERKPNFPEAYNNLGQAFFEVKKYEHAMNSFNHAIELNNRYSEALNNKANLLKIRGRLDAALEHYLLGMKVHPISETLLENLIELITQYKPTSGFDINNYPAQQEAICRVSNSNPKIIILNAISSLIENKPKSAIEGLKRLSDGSIDATLEMHPKNRKFVNGYSLFLNTLLNELPYEPNSKNGKIYHLGDSHCLSFTNCSITIGAENFQFQPAITIGAKAFHFMTGQNAFTEITKANLNKIPASSRVFVSFGEIDCRRDEGIIPAALKYNSDRERLINDVVTGYVKWFFEANTLMQHKLYFANVPAPCILGTSISSVDIELVDTIKYFNKVLEQTVKEYGYSYIDVYKITEGAEGFSNGIYHIDNTHLSHRILPSIQGCLND